jgi:integrase
MGRKPGVPTARLDDAHGAVYQFDFTRKGKRYHGSTGHTDQRLAQDWLDDHVAKIVLGRPVVRPREAFKIAPADSLQRHARDYFDYLDDQVARGKLSSSYTRKIKQHINLHFLDRWATVYEMIEPGAIDDWTKKRLSSPTLFHAWEDEQGIIHKPRSNKERPSSVTVYKELVSLRRFCVWLKGAGHIRHVPEFETVEPVSDYRAPDYTPDDVAAVLAAIPDRHAHKRKMPAREYFTVLWAQALRSDAECGTLRWCDVNLRHKEVTIRASVAKNGEERTIAMALETYAVLSEMWKEAQKHGRVLPTALIFGKHNFIGSLKRAATRLELPAITRHHLRHFRLTELGNSPGTAVAALQYFAGHRHLATTDKYVKSRTRATADMLHQLLRDPSRK